MADHRLAQSYPVAIATGVQLILGALVAAGWAKLPDSLITTIGTVVAAVVGVLAGVVAHSRVTPVTGGWAAQVRDLIRTALDDAVMQLLNSSEAAANTDAPPAAPSPSSSSSTSDVAAAGEPAVPRAARYTPPPTAPTPALTGRWVWTGETWSWVTDNAGPEATRGQRPGPGLPMPPQPGPARPGAPGPGVPPAPSARPGPR